MHVRLVQVPAGVTVLVVDMARAVVLPQLVLVPGSLVPAHFVEDMNAPNHLGRVVVAIFTKRNCVR